MDGRRSPSIQTYSTMRPGSACMVLSPTSIWCSLTVIVEPRLGSGLRFVVGRHELEQFGDRHHPSPLAFAAVHPPLVQHPLAADFGEDDGWRGFPGVRISQGSGLSC